MHKSLFGLAAGFALLLPGAGCSPGAGTDATAASDAGGTDSAPATDSGPLPCPGFAPGIVAGTVASPDVLEASGLVASRSHPDVLWTHNDSGDGPRVFALRGDGTHLGTYTLIGASATDWEDMAADDQFLYMADIGDNAEARAFVVVYRVPEPMVDAAQAAVTLDLFGTAVLELEYPDGPHNAETLLVDPLGGDLYIVTKAADGVSGVYRAPAPQMPGARVLLELTATLTFASPELPGSVFTTGGDVSPAGDAVLIRTYTGAFFWWRTPGARLDAAFDGTACPAPVQNEPQGEAIAFAADGVGYYTVSELANQPLWFHDRL